MATEKAQLGILRNFCTNTNKLLGPKKKPGRRKISPQIKIP